VTIFDDGLGNQSISDPAVLARAAKLDRAVVTLNRSDFTSRLHAAGGEHAGIIVCTVDPDHAALADRVHNEIEGRVIANELIRIQRT